MNKETIEAIKKLRVETIEIMVNRCKEYDTNFGDKPEDFGDLLDINFKSNIIKKLDCEDFENHVYDLSRVKTLDEVLTLIK
jgi:hypothetical protein